MYEPDVTPESTPPPLVVPVRRASRARRPHPARRARRFVAALSVTLMLALTGLVAQHESGSATQAVASSTQATGASSSLSATAATPSSNATTASHGS